MDHDHRLRDQLIALLRGGNAHMSFEEAVADFPERSINERPPHLPYSFWHLLEHLRLTQADILDYLTNASYQARAWPDGYWPSRDAVATQAKWDETIASFQRDLAAIVAIVADETTDLFGTVPSGGEHTVLREALIVADHNAYHVGELGILRQVANAWGERDAD
ncbi:MAG: DinB family protein [Chloroflexota bacterium]|nr:DinB family protein [Chloroflexota bacterium]